MILTVTPNIALDITYTIDKFELHSSMRVNDVADRAGGKGINVSRVLASLGYESLILGLQGGNVGAAIEADLIASQLPYELVPIVGQTRRSVGIVDRSTGDATVLNEAGPDVSGGLADGRIGGIGALGHHLAADIGRFHRLSKGLGQPVEHIFRRAGGRDPDLRRRVGAAFDLLARQSADAGHAQQGAGIGHRNAGHAPHPSFDRERGMQFQLRLDILVLGSAVRHLHGETGAWRGPDGNGGRRNERGGRPFCPPPDEPVQPKLIKRATPQRAH